MIFPSNNNSTWATYCTAVMVFNSQIAWKGGNPINNYHGFSCKKELFYVCKLLLNGSIQCYQLCLMPIAYLMVQNWFGFQSFQIRMRCNADFKNVHSFVSCSHFFLTKLFQIPCIKVGNTEFLTRKWCCAGNCLRRQKFSSLLVQVFSFFLPSPKMWLFNEMGLDLISFPLETSSTNSWFDLLVLRRSAQTHIQSLQKRHKLALTQFEKALPITRGNNKPENWLGSKNWIPLKNCPKFHLPCVV